MKKKALSLFKSREVILILGLIFLSAFPRIYMLSSQMHMISDQGWFFLAAKDMLLTGNIPLVGITSSHTWLHQGPIWTYILAGILWFGNFNPLSAGYFSVFLDILTVLVIYKVSKELFSNEIAIASSILYATSPLIIIYSRMPYHTSPIPFLSILFLLVIYRWIKGNKMYFPLAIFICTLLYNFELATVLFPAILVMFLIFGIWKNKKWAKVFNRKIFSLSALALIPMIPIIIYDYKNGFFQTIKFAGWLFFQGLGSLGIKIIPQDPHPSWQNFINFFLYEFRRIIFYRNEDISTIILMIVVFLNLLLLYKLYKRKKLKINYIVFYFISFILLSGFISQRESSGAYLTMLFPYLILLVSISTQSLTKYKKAIAYILLILIIPILNTYYLIKEYRTADGGGLNKLIKVSEFIVSDSGGRKINLEKKNFKSNIDIHQYRYLVWWKGGKLVNDSTVEYGIYNVTEGKPKQYVYFDGSIYVTKTEK